MRNGDGSGQPAQTGQRRAEQNEGDAGPRRHDRSGGHRRCGARARDPQRQVGVEESLDRSVAVEVRQSADGRRPDCRRPRECQSKGRAACRRRNAEGRARHGPAARPRIRRLMATLPAGAEIERLIQLLAKLPGLGPRSARRAALVLLKKRESLLEPLGAAMRDAAAAIRNCEICGNLDTASPCSLCRDPRRDPSVLCVVEDVADLWALERADVFKGKYHVLGGALSALDGVTPEKLNLGGLVSRVREGVEEVILAMNATVEGQTTAHYLIDALATSGVKVTRLAHGVPVGGELDYLDEGTLSAAFKARRPL